MTSLLAAFLLILFAFTCICILKWTSKSTKLPPGPKPWPIIGNLLQFGNKPHESFANLSKIYGPLMTIKLGSIITIVASSPEFAKEVLQTHDNVLSDRTVPDAIHSLDHHKLSVAWLPVSQPWRNLRKICVLQLFTMKRLNATQALRREKVQDLLHYVREVCENGEALHIGDAAFTTSLNLLTNTFFSMDLARYQSDTSQEFRDLIAEGFDLSSKLNISDLFPVLRMFDPQGVKKQTTINMKKFLKIFEDIIDQRLKVKAATKKSFDDVLDALLNLDEDNDYELTCNDIKHLFLDLFSAGTDTSTGTMEWVMAELLRNPDKMKKAQDELRQVIGKGKNIQEDDISKLPYLQATVKETLRLHPPAPFLLPHKARSDVVINGFTVPKGSQVFTNVWAIGRDPEIWSDPAAFVPERFLDAKVDYKGRDFKFIPFGAGRRICPGLPLADRLVHLMLASLLYAFDWKLEDGLKPEDLDMNDKFGFTLKKVEPLRVIPMIKV